MHLNWALCLPTGGRTRLDRRARMHFGRVNFEVIRLDKVTVTVKVTVAVTVTVMLTVTVTVRVPTDLYG